jgi:DHA3 family macrolide efflux protein-like MFS transporter
MAILQSTVSPEIQGRVFMLMGSLLSLTSPLGLAVAGPVSDWLGLRVWYLTAGVLCGVIGLAGCFIPAIVGIEHNYNGQLVTEKCDPGAKPLPAAAEAGD